ncbi:BlaI/MecI/CopY family transcriptional regulator [Pendulispora albinea]|uniref:BlaI/MecI/CopY family transcriptional regulator n=1 Tax=Pendulispora albinea TaxID=2741071 RepID=A0ABZ2LY44_9BACT
MSKDATEKPPMLTRAESEVMQVLWKREVATVHDVVEHLPRPVAYTTALTMLRILEQKGYVRHEPHPDGGRAHVYRATAPVSKVQRRHVRDLVDRLFGGRAESLVVGLLEDETWTRDELEALKSEIESRLKTEGQAAESSREPRVRAKSSKQHG